MKKIKFTIWGREATIVVRKLSNSKSTNKKYSASLHFLGKPKRTVYTKDITTKSLIFNAKKYLYQISRHKEGDVSKHARKWRKTQNKNK